MSVSAAVSRIETLFAPAEPPAIALVLGSGWGGVVDALMHVQKSCAYGELPGFPESTVEGHEGRLLYGTMAGVPVWVMQGRFHYYEGYSMAEVTFPVRVFANLGVKALMLTNAAGGIEPSYKPGDLMIISDHMNYMGDNPLRGPNDARLGPRFPDMTAAWDPALRALLEEAGRESGVALHSGVYVAVSGPNFETPAEIRAFHRLGANAVGMSTVPECLAARHAGLRVAGLSCITNLAAHTGGDPLTHEEVAVAARQSHEKVVRLLDAVLPRFEKEIEVNIPPCK
jgi:inosine and guanosine-specific purine nucleoside phosphorylase I